MNAVTETQGGALAASPAYDPFAAYGQEASAGSGNFLKFSKGEWLLGQNSDEIPLGRRLAVNMAEMTIGWIRWVDGKPAERRMGLLAQGYKPESRDALGHDDLTLWEKDKDGKAIDPWTFTNELPMADPETGEQMTFAASSKGGIGGVRNLCKAYGKEYRQRVGMVPVIELQRDSYIHPEYKKLYVPVLPIVEWVPADGVPAPAASNDTDDEPAAPAKAAAGSKTRF